MTLNIDVDDAVKTLTSDDRALKLTYIFDDIFGDHRFHGNVGAGKLEMFLPKNVSIVGHLTGGPAEERPFSGTCSCMMLSSGS